MTSTQEPTHTPTPQPTPEPTPQASKGAALRGLLLGGLLPVIAFAVVEEYYGTVGGVIAGIVFGVGEMIWEYRKTGRVQGITIGGNALVIVLGLVSIFEGSGVWFKLQPAIVIFVFACLLIGSNFIGKPILLMLAQKQRPDLPPSAFEKLKGINLRLGFVMLGVTALSVHAAFYWSTAAWASLKGFGVPVILFVYMGVEVLIIRLLNRR